MLSITSRWSRKRSSAPRRCLVERESGVERAPESEGGQQPGAGAVAAEAAQRAATEVDGAALGDAKVLGQHVREEMSKKQLPAGIKRLIDAQADEVQAAAQTPWARA